MNPFGGLDYFLLLLIVLLPVVVCGLLGKRLRVCGMLVCAVMLLAIFRTPRALLLLAAFWLWQTALTFGYLHLRRRAKKPWVFHLAVFLSLLPLLLVKLSLWVEPLRALSMLTVQAPMPEHAPLQPAKLLPDAAWALKVTCVPAA